jgi:hypothetical protein
MATIASLIGMGLVGPATAATEDERALTDLVQILRNQGVLDEGQYNQLTAKAARREAKESWTDRFSFWGDFRGRYEGFYYVGDDDDVPDRSRLRYRFRLNARAKVNSRASILFRLASGFDDDRTTNLTLGDLPDFASDPIRIDRVYVRISPFVEGRVPGESGTAWIEFGKVPNPYVWKVGQDFMLWDHDINLEGVNFLFEDDLTEDLNVFVNSGYYVVEELKEHGDPNLLAAQLGGHLRLSEEISVGGRMSWFRFGDISNAQIMRGVDGTLGVTSAGGNIPDGLTGDVNNNSMNVIEGGFYLKARFFADWPITLFGNVSSNLDAASSFLVPGADAEDLAWGVGGEIGDKKKYVKVGVGYWQIEANAFFSQFIDSDLFDGKTNRKGFAFYGSKQIMDRTEVSLTTFWSKPIDSDLPNSASKGDRVRVQADMKFKF